MDGALPQQLISLDLFSVVAVIATGLVAGFFNVTAGGGSTLTLPLLMVLLGLPGPVANGSNRVAIIVQNLVAVPTFRQGGVRGIRRILPLVALALPGTLIGAWLGVTISDQLFRRILAFVMIGLAGTVFATSRKTPTDESENRTFTTPTLMSFLFIGFYAGFIQAGVGFFIIFALSGLQHLPLVRVHAYKVAIVLLLQLAALPVFLLGGAVNATVGLLLAVGLAGGGFIGARITLKGDEKLLRILLALGALALAFKLLI